MKLHCIFVFIASVYFANGQQCNNSDGCYEKRDGGKTICDCCDRDNPAKNPCAATSCPTGSVCVPRTKPCNDGVGFHINCPFQLVGTCRKNCAKFQSCAAGCHEVYDANGCKTCYCDKEFSSPCMGEYNGCNPDQECILMSEGKCGTKPCQPFATCKKICEPLGNCPSTCVKYIDSEGCQACHCCNHCVNHKCEAGKKCILQEVQCFAPPCYPLPKCVSK